MFKNITLVTSGPHSSQKSEFFKIDNTVLLFRALLPIAKDMAICRWP